MSERIRRAFLALSIACFGLCASAGNLLAQTTGGIELPDTGVDIEGHITAVGTALGAIVVVAVGLIFAFMLVRKGIRWARSV